MPTKPRDFRKILGFKASEDELLLKNNTVLVHHWNNKMVRYTHLAHSAHEIWILMARRNHSWNFGKRQWGKNPQQINAKCSNSLNFLRFGCLSGWWRETEISKCYSSSLKQQKYACENNPNNLSHILRSIYGNKLCSRCFTMDFLNFGR